MKNLDKHYEKMVHYMRVENRYDCPDKIYFEIWERLKKEKKDERLYSSKF